MKKWYLVLALVMLIAGFFLLKPLFFRETHFEMRADTALRAADKMRVSFKKMVTSENSKLLGFNSVKEFESATLGDPLMRIRLRGDSILNYAPSKGENLEPMVFSRSKIVPLVVDNRARSTILVDSSSLRGGPGHLNWQAHELGNRSLAEVIDKAVPRLSEQTKLPASAFTLVEIPAMDRRYLAYQTGQGGFFALADSMPPLCWPDKDGNPVRISAALAAMSNCKALKLAYEPPPRLPVAMADSMILEKRAEVDP